MQQSEQIPTILCYGNNGFKSADFKLALEKEQTGNLPFHIYYAPDLNIFNMFAKPVYTPELVQLIGQEGQIGRGISVFLILITMTSIFSPDMFDLISRIPDILGLNPENEEYFWKRVVIAFNTNDHPNPKEMIQSSFKGNDILEEVVKKAGDRYVYVSRSDPNNLIDRIMEQCKTVINANGGREFIGGGDVNRRAKQAETDNLQSMHKSTSMQSEKVVKTQPVRDSCSKGLNTPLIDSNNGETNSKPNSRFRCGICSC